MAARVLVCFSRSSRLQRILTVPCALSARSYSNDVQKPPSQPSQGVLSMLKTKTGVTGQMVLGTGVVATLLSKEIYVVNAETLVAVIMLGTTYWLVTKQLGKPTADYLDNRSQDILDLFNRGKIANIKRLEEQIAVEQNVENVLSIRSELFDIIKEENDMLREEEYRRRLANAKDQVKKRLDYQLQTETMEKQYQHKHVVAWIEEAVRQTVQNKPDESIPQCISNLKTMSTSV